MESEGGNENEEVTSKQLSFVLLLRKYPVLLEKSQIPAVKMAKSRAVASLADEIALKLGLIYTDKVIYKKITNMKTKVKQKTGENQTGNRKIDLSLWEKIFLEMLKPETNPTFSKVPGAISVGVSSLTSQNGVGSLVSINHLSNSISEEMPTDLSISPMPTFHITAQIPSRNIPSAPETAKKRKIAEDIIDNLETDETRVLSTTQLQRVVLLEQLKLVKLKQLKIQKEIGNSESEFDTTD